MLEVLHSSETSVLKRATWRNISEDGILRLPSGFPQIFCVNFSSLQFLPNAQPISNKKQTNKLRGPESASELYRLIYRFLSAKFSANFCG
jgi:hypothetical protein